MRREPSQVERVLALLQQRGKLGVNLSDFMAPTCDGYKPITRLAARIYDLQHKHGYRITERKAANGTSNYFLLAEVERSAGTPDSSTSDVGGSRDASADVSLNSGLFDAEQFRPKPLGAYEEAA